MKRIFIVLQIAILISCSSKSETGAKPKRYLHFTSNFPSSVFWEVMVTYGSKSGMFWCKDLSMGDGGLVPSTKYENYTLKNANDTLKVPLFWSKTNLCGWEMSDLSIRVRGRPLLMHQIYLKEKTRKQERPTKPIPDYLAYICNYDPKEDQLDCDAENGETIFDFILNDTIAINHLKIDLKGF